jgi:hypothetical protein
MTFAGIDRSVYPGDDFMSGLMSHSNLLWTGFYLGPAPKHRDTSWMTKRETLRSQGPGWGLAPIFLGQQDRGTLTAKQGTTDAELAAELADKAGFDDEPLPGLAVIYLDIEVGGRLTAGWMNYVNAWCKHIRSDETKYRPGIYCSHNQTAAQIAADNDDAFIWVYNINKYKNKHSQAMTDETTFRKPDMADAGFEGATAWQWIQEYVEITTTLPDGTEQTLKGWDLDVSAVPDPSLPSRDFDTSIGEWT